MLTEAWDWLRNPEKKRLKITGKPSSFVVVFSARRRIQALIRGYLSSIRSFLYHVGGPRLEGLAWRLENSFFRFGRHKSLARHVERSNETGATFQRVILKTHIFLTFQSWKDSTFRLPQTSLLESPSSGFVLALLRLSFPLNRLSLAQIFL